MTTPDIVSPQTLRFERLLDAPVEAVWRYLIDPELRARWFMGGPTEPRPGGVIGMTMEHDRLSHGDAPMPDRYRQHVGHSWQERITRIVPPRLLAFTWEGGKAGEVTIELSEANGGTRLVLTHAGLRGRPDALDFGPGWHAHLAVLVLRLQAKPVANFWTLHAEAERMVAETLDALA